MLWKGYVMHIGKRSSLYDMQCEKCGHEERMQVWRGIEPKCSKCEKRNKKIKKMKEILKGNTGTGFKHHREINCAECEEYDFSYENEYPALCVACGTLKHFETWKANLPRYRNL